MRTRSSDSSKTPASKKSSPPKRASARKSKQAADLPSVVEEASEVAKRPSGSRTVKKVIKNVVKKTPVSRRATRSAESDKAKIEEATEENLLEDSKTPDALDNEPLSGVLMEDENAVGNPEKSSKNELGETWQLKKHSVGTGEESSTTADTKFRGGQTLNEEDQKDELEEKMEEPEKTNDKGDSTIGMEDNSGNLAKGSYASQEEAGDEKMEEPKESNDQRDPTTGMEDKSSDLLKGRNASLEESGNDKMEESKESNDQRDPTTGMADNISDLVKGIDASLEESGNDKMEEPKESKDQRDPTTGMEDNSSDLLKGRNASLEESGNDKMEESKESNDQRDPTTGMEDNSSDLLKGRNASLEESGNDKMEESKESNDQRDPTTGMADNISDLVKGRNASLEESGNDKMEEPKESNDQSDPTTGMKDNSSDLVKGRDASLEESGDDKMEEPKESNDEGDSTIGIEYNISESVKRRDTFLEEAGDEKMEEPKESNDEGDPTMGMEDNSSDLVKRRRASLEEVGEEKTEEPKGCNNKEELTIGMEEKRIDVIKREDASTEEVGEEKIEGLSDQEVHEEFGGEDIVDDDKPGNEAERETLEEEHDQFNAAARERKLRKEREVFVGGLDRDAVEEDIRRVFEHAGEVVEVRMHVDPLTHKNKGYAFVQFATKGQASRALSDMKNPVIRGKRCGTSPSEDNDTLFLGNICNTWTKEAVKQKLKDYGLEGVESINLVADPRYEGLSRGFAFVEFSSHAEAMLAYKRLQKPDIVFGHSDRTAKVAFAEPLREPDPEVMAQVKSVFIDGIPPYWGEGHVRGKFKIFGEIARVMLARNMSTAKRKDYGFVDFSTHEAAVSCVEGVNNNGLSDGNTKVKVRARLSNPLPKMQAVKGGMRGGFRIGYGTNETYPRSFGRGSGRGRAPVNQANFQYGRGFYPRGPGYGGRTGFPNESGFSEPYHSSHRRQNFGRGEGWGAHQGPVARPYLDRGRHDTTGRGYNDYNSHSRQPYSFEGGYGRGFMGRHVDHPYPYDDVAHHGIKRPYYMMDHEHDLAATGQRPRLNHFDPTVPVHSSRYRDGLGADGGAYPHNHYGSDYGSGAYPPFYGGDRAYGRGNYY